MRVKGDQYGVHSAIYVNSVFIASQVPEDITSALKTTHIFELKGSGPTEVHLGCDLFRDEEGNLCHAPIKYIVKVISTYKCLDANPRMPCHLWFKVMTPNWRLWNSLTLRGSRSTSHSDWALWYHHCCDNHVTIPSSTQTGIMSSIYRTELTRSTLLSVPEQRYWTIPTFQKPSTPGRICATEEQKEEISDNAPAPCGELAVLVHITPQ